MAPATPIAWDAGSLGEHYRVADDRPYTEMSPLFRKMAIIVFADRLGASFSEWERQRWQ